MASPQVKQEVPDPNDASPPKLPVKKEEEPLTTTVFVAAPLVKKLRLGITGKDSNLGSWKTAKGDFECVHDIGNSYGIFKGIIPVPNDPGAPFKFGFYDPDEKNKKIQQWEGEGNHHNRHGDLLPGCWDFFVFMVHEKSTILSVIQSAASMVLGSKPERGRKTVAYFVSIVLERIKDEFMNLDDAFDFLDESLKKIKGTDCQDSQKGIADAVDKVLQEWETFDHLLFPLICAGLTKMDSKILKDFLINRSFDFSLFLHHLLLESRFQRTSRMFFEVLETMARYAGGPYCWLYFRLNRRQTPAWNTKEIANSLIGTMQSIPQVLFFRKDVATSAIGFCLQNGQTCDQLYSTLIPIKATQADYSDMIDSIFLEKIRSSSQNLESKKQVLRFETVRHLHNAYIENPQQSEQFAKFLSEVFDQPLPATVVRLAVTTPDYLIPTVRNIVVEIFQKKFNKAPVYKGQNQDDMKYLAARIESKDLDAFPTVKKQVHEILLEISVECVNNGLVHQIASHKLILMALKSRKNVPFLQRSSIIDLQKGLTLVPRNLFQNLHKAIGSDPERRLNSYRRGELGEIVDNIVQHFDLIDEIIKKAKNRAIPLIEINHLLDSQVVSYLRNVDNTLDVAVINRDLAELKKRHKLQASLFQKFSQVNDVTILSPENWNEYLENISDRSIISLRTALDLEEPLPRNQANWLERISDCMLFMHRIWQPIIEESTPSLPLSAKDFRNLIQASAVRWKRLGIETAEGNIMFQEMEENVRLLADPQFLSNCHLDGLPVVCSSLTVLGAYHDFKTLRDIRHVIKPFMAALRYFTIVDNQPIEDLYTFVTENLLLKWNETKLVDVRRTGIIKTLENYFNIDPERPETKSTLEFISSLVTDEDQSPLIEWLRNKTEQDMEAMGRILQGNLLEAYGMLQTLKTRIAPFFKREFQSYNDLLRVLSESERNFAARVNRVQAIDPKFLVNILPEIEAAVRAAVISPYEDAREKLSKLSRLSIQPKEDGHTVKIVLAPTGSLTLEDLQQAFQLLEMSAMDDRITTNNEEWVQQTRETVVLVFRLCDLFQDLLASGCITYTFRGLDISLTELDFHIQERKEQLRVWNEHLKRMQDMPHLELFSREYLLHLADLVYQSQTEQVISILRMFLPLASKQLEKLAAQLVRRFSRSPEMETEWLTTEQLFDLLRELHEIIEVVFHKTSPEQEIPPFLVVYGRNLLTHFLDKSVQILNVPRESVVGCALAAYLAVTRRSIDPSRILFITANTGTEEVSRFMTLWSVGNPETDFFIMVHIERLSTVAASAVRDTVARVVPERRTKLLLLAQHHCQIQATKSLGARLGIVSDRMLEINFTTNQLREYLSRLLPRAVNIHFFTSKYPGCGKSQQIMRMATHPIERKSPAYFRIPVRTGSVEELLLSLKKVEHFSTRSQKQSVFFHLDVAHSCSLEFNDILLSLLIHGALFDPKKAKQGFWTIGQHAQIAIELASPFSAKEFPIIEYLGRHVMCVCDHSVFTYDLAVMPRTLGEKVSLDRSNALVAAAKFLMIKQNGLNGVVEWDQLCQEPEMLFMDPIPEQQAFNLLLTSFQHAENHRIPTFSSIASMANFIFRHMNAMRSSMWFNQNAIFLFESPNLAQLFKANVFDLLLKVANDAVSRSWSIDSTQHQADMDWAVRQRAIFILGLNQEGDVIGMNVVGRDQTALKNMFHPNLLPILEQQCLRFQELKGFKNLTERAEGADVAINAMRSLLLLDGSDVSMVKIYQLDGHDRRTSARHRLQTLIGEDFGYVLTGDNITKMMFALYRIRCGLPVMVFGEAGVGKSALFRFLIQTLLGHDFHVCNVNSGTTIADISAMIEEALRTVVIREEAQVFLFFDEMNTADPYVIAFLKELMLDRHFNGTALPDNIFILAAANPYRSLQESDKEAAVGLSFRFATSLRQTQESNNLVYRVNPLPLSFFDHVYDFGHLCDEAEDTYIEEICRQNLTTDFDPHSIEQFIKTVRKSHKVARFMSPDGPSAVSLRDATRAVQLYHWFRNTEAGKQMASTNLMAAELSIYLVYAFRFTKRKLFLEQVFKNRDSAVQSMKKASRMVAEKLYKEARGASIGSGAIALNEALCENLFALYVCVLNGIFVIIVGRPGSSKSLSVEILKLVLSPGNHKLRQSLGGLPALTELYFQCSPLSTSSGFKALFESAQRLSNDPKIMLAMVVLDELGLADLSPEKPIKVLHSELERKAVLTSGETQQSSYSVVALSNWVVDAAQVNRGILIQRQKAKGDDLFQSAKELAASLIKQYANESRAAAITERLARSLDCVAETYQRLDEAEDIGGGHFFSMRDFFFCVKNFVCSVLSSTNGQNEGTLHVSKDHVIRSAIRNFGGHDAAQKMVRALVSTFFMLDESVVPECSPLDLIMENIQDSSKDLSVHIARHLMILNRSLIGLQLLNRHVRPKMGEGVGWHVLFGSCFPGDLKILAVTRKLQQVEQAIRAGGVLILCHADQLFESLYMVLNQQYWAQGEVTMTQIALGPSTRSIALPNGPFRIIALQNTDVALNRDLMSPAVLSRFEKHELRPSHLLNEAGREWLTRIESHPVWVNLHDSVRKRRLLYGYHEETFASLALHMQNLTETQMELEDQGLPDVHYTWMRAVQPMEMIKLERSGQPAITEICRTYRNTFVLENLQDALATLTSNRLILMTNTLRHLEITLDSISYSVIRLFEINSELELHGMLDGIPEEALNSPDYCLFIQYDAMTEPIEQFQITKYEIETRMEKANCRVVFVVHVDPRLSNKMRWVFSFGDGWEYCFVDEILPVSQIVEHRIPLKVLVDSTIQRTMVGFVRALSGDSFKSLLLEMLGPNMQESLANLRASLGQFYGGVRTALSLDGNSELIQLLKECLVAQLESSNMRWNVVEAVSDADFDSSSSLTEALWGVFKHKLSYPLSHLLLISDICKISNSTSIDMWCQFIRDNYPDRLLIPNTEQVVDIPFGFRVCTQPFSRLLPFLKRNYNPTRDQNENQDVEMEEKVGDPTQWLLNYIRNNEEDGLDVKEAYFGDWLLMQTPPHLHGAVRRLPFSSMRSIMNDMFDDPDYYLEQWKQHEARVIAALELLAIAAFTKDAEEVLTGTSAGTEDGDLWETGKIRNWNVFSQSAARVVLSHLSRPTTFNQNQKFFQAITSIEVNKALEDLVNSIDDMSNLWLGLRITKRMLLFDSNCDVKLPELQGLTGEKLFRNLTTLVIESVIRPRLAADGERHVRQSNLLALLSNTGISASPEEFAQKVKQCPRTNSFIPLEEIRDDVCPRCDASLTPQAGDAAAPPHLVSPNRRTAEALYEDYQKFLFFFERTAELFIHHKGKRSQDILAFINHLTRENRLQVSWRFMTVIIRNILSVPGGKATIDSALASIRCNRPADLTPNAGNFLRALVACADEDARVEDLEHIRLTNEELNDTVMTENWTVDRISRLARVRRLLSEHGQAVAPTAVNEWNRWRINERGTIITDKFLFFILRFITGEGDETKLGQLLSNLRIREQLSGHPVVSAYTRVMSPLSLGFQLLPANSPARNFDNELVAGRPITNQRYRILQELQPDWAPFIARFAIHLSTVATAHNIGILSGISINPATVGQYYLPGVDNHPHLESFNAENFRWYVCRCGTLNYVGNCGHVVTATICPNCNISMGLGGGGRYPFAAQVRQATLQDFPPPLGLHIDRIPPAGPLHSVRGKTPLVTRCSVLLVTSALLAGILNEQTGVNAVNHIFQTLPRTDQRNDDNIRSLIEMLSTQLMTSMNVFHELFGQADRQLTMVEKFKILHLLLHKLLETRDPNLSADPAQFRAPQGRENFENALANILARNGNMHLDLQRLSEQSDEASRTFKNALIENEKSSWAYVRPVFSNRRSVQLELARNANLQKSYKFLGFLLDDFWANKLDSLQFLGDAMRFVALVRTVLQGQITQDETQQMSIGDGLQRIIELVEAKAVILDRGRPVNSAEQVDNLFAGLKGLWDRFSQLPNAENKTFLDHFECQQVALNVRPKTVLDEDAPLILILAGSGLPETIFVCQLLAHAVEAAASVSSTNFIQPYCRAKSGRVRLSCLNAAAMAEFDESLYAHVSVEEVDSFLSDHAIDKSTLQLANSFAMAAILGPAGSTIAEDLILETFSEFIFKDVVESNNFLLNLERRFLAWQPTRIPTEIQDRIIADLEKNRTLAEAKAVLVSASQFVQQNTEPLLISKVRNSFVSDIIAELSRAGIITERHLSNDTVTALDSHLKLEVRHLLGLLKAICSRMKGDDIFGGRIPEGWNKMLSEQMAQRTSQLLRAHKDSVVETLLNLINIINQPDPAPELQPQRSLLLAIRQLEGEDWDGIGPELRMEHIGHVLLLAESLN